MAYPTQLSMFAAAPSGDSGPDTLSLRVPPGEPATFSRWLFFGGSIGELLSKLKAKDERYNMGDIALVIADPPWAEYGPRRNGAPEKHYPVLPTRVIAEYLGEAAQLLAPGGRLALWHCAPLAAEGLSGDRADFQALCMPGKMRCVSMGAWSKSGHGPGYHWSGDFEPVFLWVTAWHSGPALQGTIKGRASNAHASERGEHSEKPVAWQADWIRQWVPRGMGVLDLFAGHGSVAEALLIADAEDRAEFGEGPARFYLGAEIDATRLEVAVGRVVAKQTTIRHAEWPEKE